MAQGVVTVNERGARFIVQYANVGPWIDAAVLDLVHVLRQAEYTMGVGAECIGFDHKGGRLYGILRWDLNGSKRSRDERLEFRNSDAYVAHHGLDRFAHTDTIEAAIISSVQNTGTLYPKFLLRKFGLLGEVGRPSSSRYVIEDHDMGFFDYQVGKH